MSNATRVFCTFVFFVVYVGGLFLFVTGEAGSDVQRELYGLIAMVGMLGAAAGWSLCNRMGLEKRIKELERLVAEKQTTAPE